MRIVHITAGAGGRLCGSCLHDNTLVLALQMQGCDAILLPAYVPTTTDETASLGSTPTRARAASGPTGSASPIASRSSGASSGRMVSSTYLGFRGVSWIPGRVKRPAAGSTTRP